MKDRTRLRAVEPEALDVDLDMDLDMDLDLTGAFERLPSDDRPLLSKERATPATVAGDVAAMSARIDALARSVDALHAAIRQRDTDYGSQVGRAVERALAERDTSAEVMSNAIATVSDQLAAILEQVTESIRHSRQVSAQNDELARHLSGGFYHAGQQLTDAATEVRGLLSGQVQVRDRASAGAIDSLRSELRDQIHQARNDIAEEVTALRKVAVRQRNEERQAHPAAFDVSALSDALDSVRSEVTDEVAALVTELHEERALVMKQLLASQQEMQQLREEVTAAIGGSSGQRSRLDSDISRLLIELRALRRRPTLETPARAPAMDSQRMRRPVGPKPLVAKRALPAS